MALPKTYRVTVYDRATGRELDGWQVLVLEAVGRCVGNAFLKWSVHYDVHVIVTEWVDPA